MCLNETDYTEIFQICFPQLFDQKTRENDTSFFENLPQSAHSEVFGKLNYEEYYKLEEEISILENLSFCFQKRKHSIQLNRPDLLDFCESLICLYEYLLKEKQWFIKTLEVKEANKYDYEELNRFYSNLFEKIDCRFKKVELCYCIGYFYPIKLKNSNLIYGHFLKDLFDCSSFKLVLKKIGNKNLLLKQLKEYHKYAMQTDTAILEKIEISLFWVSKSNTWKELCDVFSFLIHMF